MNRIRVPCLPVFAALFVVGVAVVAQTSDDLVLADNLYKAGKWSESRQAFQKALALNPESDDSAAILLKIGVCFEREAMWDEAVAAYRRILESASTSATNRARANLRTGYSMRRDGRDREAIVFLLAAASDEEAEPNIRAEGYLYTAWAYGVLEEPDQAMANFRKVETVDDAHRNLVATAYLNIGRILQERGEYREAIAAFEKIAEFDPVAATNRSRARIYLLECEALLGGDNPFHIRPCVVDATQSTVRLFWVSQGESPDEGAVVVKQGGETVQRVTASVGRIPGTICRKHSAELTGLSAGSDYGYEVICGDKRVAGAFHTAPSPGSSFAFAVIGDTQSYHENLQPLLDALGEEQADFVIHVGDLVDKGDLWGEWKAGFFDPGWSYLRHSILRPAFGNHDGGPYYPGFFKAPEGTLYYSFDWADGHFVVLDSYGAGSGGTGRAAQLAWLEQDLAANRKPWTIVSLHVPMVATRSAIKWFGKDDFLPMLEKHGVDLVFSGHHPLYRRYRPIGDRAILHVTSGGGGGPVGGYVPSPVLAAGAGMNHYCRVEMDKDRLRLMAKDASGAVIDHFELTRNRGDWRDGWRSEIVATGAAESILPLYQELLTDRTFRLALTANNPVMPGEAVQLTLDLDRLPRGTFDTRQLPEGANLTVESTPESAWKIDAQSLPLNQRRLVIEAVAPAALKVSGERLMPGGEVALGLTIGSRRFETFKAGIQVTQGGVSQEQGVR